MAPALFWVLLVAGLVVSLPIGWRIGYRAGRRDHSGLVAEEWGEHVDQALSVFRTEASKTIHDEIREAMRRHPSNVSYLRDRRDKIT